MNEEKDPKKKRLKKRVDKETPREKDIAKVPAEQEVIEQGTKKKKSGHVKMIARKRPRPQPDDDSDDEHRKCPRIVTFNSTIDSEIMEKSLLFLSCTRQDLFHLYDLVMKQYSEITPEDIELILWRDLKIMMESSTEENDQELKDGTIIYMLVERRYPLSKELFQRMLNLGLEVEEESTAALHLIQEYALWNVIENGNSWVPAPVATTPESASTIPKMTVHATAEEKTCKKNDVKARSLLLMCLPNEHQLTFNTYKDAQSISKSLDSIFNRLQKLDTHVVVWINKPDFETMGLDDLYNNFKIVEQKIKKSTGISNGDKNLAFVTALVPIGTNDTNTAIPEVSTTSTKSITTSTKLTTATFSDATTYAFISSQLKGSQIFHEDLNQLHDDDLEEMDLKWNMALISMRARKFYKRTGRMIILDGSNTVGYDKSKSDMDKEHVQKNMALMAFSDSEEVAILKREVGVKEYELGVLRSELEKFKKEKDGIDFKITIFDKSAKDLGLDEFKEPEVNMHAPRENVPLPTNNYEKESNNSEMNTDDSLEQHQVSDSDSSTVESHLRPNNAYVNTAKGNPQMYDKGFVDSRCSRHMTGNLAYLSNFIKFDGGNVTFGGGTYGGMITGKGTLKTNNLDFEDVYFVNELKFNLFSVSQMCDKKNHVLFTDTECLVLSPEFKLPDENQDTS
ncbi:hypothetical protein Tco_0302808 [Tanacetum coccineum]